jgi:hypothetical protein
MAVKKLDKNTYPPGHTADDFEVFGPAATKDGQFEGTMLADLGCFKQDGVDSNKYYHGAVVQSKKDQSWWDYFEFGRTDEARKPTIQFVPASSKEEAIQIYIKQMRSKNDKRGVFVDHPTLGRILQPKEGDDCYMVRALATRTTGLPDAKKITQNEGAKVQKITVGPVSKTPATVADPVTVRLMQDLNVGTIAYTKSSMANASLPTQVAIDECRNILTEAQKRVKFVGNSVDDQVHDKELVQLTGYMYGRIPKKKALHAPPEKWILSQDNIGSWLQDLDAFENALYATNLSQPQADPFGGMKIKMRHLTPRDNVGEFVHAWFPKASRLKHGYSGLKIINAWEVERDGDVARLTDTQKKIASRPIKITEKPRHQPDAILGVQRPDLSRDEAKLFAMSHTVLGIHGTRSVNVSGLLRTSWRLPSELVGVKITAWMFGPGCYWADDWGKSVGYTSYSGSRYTGGEGGVNGRGAFMFVADVALGTSYVAPEDEAFTKAPAGHHSVCGKAGYTKGWNGALVNNEFITYDVAQCRARYLIEFTCGR